jgi:hypothetical protein
MGLLIYIYIYILKKTKNIYQKNAGKEENIFSLCFDSMAVPRVQFHLISNNERSTRHLCWESSLSVVSLLLLLPLVQQPLLVALLGRLALGSPGEVALLGRLALLLPDLCELQLELAQLLPCNRPVIEAFHLSRVAACICK